MNELTLQSLAASFPAKYESIAIDIPLDYSEYFIFEKGIFASDMDEKWHIFVINNMMYFVRSWTMFCIYKVEIKKAENKVHLVMLHANRNKSQYGGSDISNDCYVLSQVIRIYIRLSEQGRL